MQRFPATHAGYQWALLSWLGFYAQKDLFDGVEFVRGLELVLHNLQQQIHRMKFQLQTAHTTVRAGWGRWEKWVLRTVGSSPSKSSIIWS